MSWRNVRKEWNYRNYRDSGNNKVSMGVRDESYNSSTHLHWKSNPPSWSKPPYGMEALALTQKDLIQDARDLEYDAIITDCELAGSFN